ncbi:hypothetical protein ABLA76_03075 [Xenorhabdus sp. SGI240]
MDIDLLKIIFNCFQSIGILSKQIANNGTTASMDNFITNQCTDKKSPPLPDKIIKLLECPETMTFNVNK